MRRTITSIIVVVVIACASYAIASVARLRLEWLSFVFVFGILAVLLGFLLTIYTFSIPLMDSIANKVVTAVYSQGIKENIIRLYDSGFREIRHSIKIMAYLLIVILFIQILSSLSFGVLCIDQL